MFRKPVKQGIQGDRIGLLVKNLDAEALERGIAYAPGHLQTLSTLIIDLNKIKFFKSAINNQTRFHICCNNQTVMGQLALFSRPALEPVPAPLFHGSPPPFDAALEYDFAAAWEPQPPRRFWALVLLERPLVATRGSFVLGGKFDTDPALHQCRLAFFGHVLATDRAALKVSRMKCRRGAIDRVVDDRTLIVKGLFKAETHPAVFLKKPVEIEGAGVRGVVQAAFGQSGKVKCVFPQSVYLDAAGQLVEALEQRAVLFTFKKFYYQS